MLQDQEAAAGTAAGEALQPAEPVRMVEVSIDTLSMLTTASALLVTLATETTLGPSLLAEMEPDGLAYRVPSALLPGHKPEDGGPVETMVIAQDLMEAIAEAGTTLEAAEPSVPANDDPAPVATPGAA